MSQRLPRFLFFVLVGWFATLSVRGASTGYDAEAARDRKTKDELLVVGNLNSPGTQKIDPGKKITVAEAIKLAGGFNRLANKKVKVTRFDEKGESHIHMLSLRDPKSPDADFQVQAGDVVYAFEIWI